MSTYLFLSDCHLAVSFTREKPKKVVTYCRSKVQSFSEHIGNDDKKIDFTETNKLSTEMNHSALIAQM